MCNARPSSLKNVSNAVRQVRAAMHPFNLKDIKPAGSPLTEKLYKLNHDHKKSNEGLHSMSSSPCPSAALIET